MVYQVRTITKSAECALNIEYALNIAYQHAVCLYEPTGQNLEPCLSEVSRHEEFFVWLAARNIFKRAYLCHHQFRKPVKCVFPAKDEQ